MKLELLDKLIVKPIYKTCYMAAAGSFSLADIIENNAVRKTLWDTCREEFATRWTDHPTSCVLMQLSNSDKSQNIVDFIELTEDKLRLRKENRSKIYIFKENERPEFTSPILIELSEWWQKSELRKQFFTAMIRAARLYKNSTTTQDKKSCISNYICDRNDYNSVLYSVKYFNRTKLAVEYFLAGNTIWKDCGEEMKGGRGWMWYFYTNGKSPEALLRKPIKKKS